MHTYLAPEMVDEIKRLAEQYPFTFEKVKKYYMMGGYDHAKKLLDYEIATGAPRELVLLYNQAIWDGNNINMLELLNRLSNNKLVEYP